MSPGWIMCELSWCQNFHVNSVWRHCSGKTTINLTTLHKLRQQAKAVNSYFLITHNIIRKKPFLYISRQCLYCDQLQNVFSRIWPTKSTSWPISPKTRSSCGKTRPPLSLAVSRTRGSRLTLSNCESVASKWRDASVAVAPFTTMKEIGFGRALSAARN